MQPPPVSQDTLSIIARVPLRRCIAEKLDLVLKSKREPWAELVARVFERKVDLETRLPDLQVEAGSVETLESNSVLCQAGDLYLECLKKTSPVEWLTYLIHYDEKNTARSRNWVEALVSADIANPDDLEVKALTWKRQVFTTLLVDEFGFSLSGAREQCEQDALRSPIRMVRKCMLDTLNQMVVAEEAAPEVVQSIRDMFEMEDHVMFDELVTDSFFPEGSGSKARLFAYAKDTFHDVKKWSSAVTGMRDGWENTKQFWSSAWNLELKSSHFVNFKSDFKGYAGQVSLREVKRRLYQGCSDYAPEGELAKVYERQRKEVTGHCDCTDSDCKKSGACNELSPASPCPEGFQCACEKKPTPQRVGPAFAVGFVASNAVTVALLGAASFAGGAPGAVLAFLAGCWAVLPDALPAGMVAMYFKTEASSTCFCYELRCRYDAKEAMCVMQETGYGKASSNKYFKYPPTGAKCQLRSPTEALNSGTLSQMETYWTHRNEAFHLDEHTKNAKNLGSGLANQTGNNLAAVKDGTFKSNFDAETAMSRGAWVEAIHATNRAAKEEGHLCEMVMCDVTDVQHVGPEVGGTAMYGKVGRVADDGGKSIYNCPSRTPSLSGLIVNSKTIPSKNGVDIANTATGRIDLLDELNKAAVAA